MVVDRSNPLITRVDEFIIRPVIGGIPSNSTEENRIHDDANSYNLEQLWGIAILALRMHNW